MMSSVSFRPGCPVCFEPLDPDAVYSLPCGHTFDEKCIRNWLDSSKTCPSCRAPADSHRLMKVHFAFPTLQTSVEVEMMDNVSPTTTANSSQSKQKSSTQVVDIVRRNRMSDQIFILSFREHSCDRPRVRNATEGRRVALTVRQR